MPAPQTRDYAIVVGIDTYADTEFLEPLAGPKHDIQNFVEWLKSPQGGNVPEENIAPYLLVSDELGQKPKSGDFVEIIGKLLALAPGDQRIGRRLYMFLAGHGVAADLDDTGLLTVEATEDAPTYVEGRRYANLFRGRAVFEEVVLVMDCCRDFDGELPPPVFPFKRKLDTGGASKVKRFYAYATGFGKAAREKEFAGKVSGVFSHVLLAGLNGGAIDGEGRITGPSLERYLRKRLKDALPPGVEQPPDIRSDPDLVFGDGYPPATASVTVSTSVPHHRFSVLYGDGFAPVTTLPEELGGGVYRVALPIGKTYVFQLLDAPGGVIRQVGRAVEDAQEVIHVNL
ncbi:hypothetical protein HP532_09785 [Pseudomonas sp. CrR25]|nr:hypothetical protein [Pseudomonas sp. CrR25]